VRGGAAGDGDGEGVGCATIGQRLHTSNIRVSEAREVSARRRLIIDPIMQEILRMLLKRK